ncbi:Abi family protein [Sanguibacter sp. Leaf3]|uniref:Abi family protein n=1 Tax=Sanguibacter sp. Leaf3 TaxID=1736209 RepID=UPI0006F43F18|nr:Abi family protein [Sanguibacter sp. Leaf3]KQT96167.1 hypothetical protein ASG53_13540 [Sanguibacter sp. Leaf3]
MGNDYEHLRAHLSEPRLHLYLTATAHRPDEALALYEWNARLAASFFVDLGHLEVALRNALDTRMTLRHASRQLDGTWIDDPAGELGRDLTGTGRHSQPYRDIATARTRVRANQKPFSHAQVLSETSFGLWHQLVSKRWTNIWPDLADAFPHAPDRARDTVADPVARLRDLRNRISHHHRVWSQPCSELHVDLLAVAGYISPHLATWITDRSAVPDLLKQRQPGIPLTSAL